MKIAIVTSEVTFVKENYNQFLDVLFSNSHDLEFHLIILKNNGPKLLFKGLGLIILGAKRIGLTLIKNSLTAIFSDHQKLATKYGIQTTYFKNANELGFYNLVNDQKIDLIVNARTRNIYKNKILKAPPLGCINIHHGILPDYRGTMCDLYALYEGRPAGFSIHKMEVKIDSGIILKTKEVTRPHSPSSKNFSQHIFNSSKVEGLELSRLLKTISTNKLLPIEQENKSNNIIYTKNPHFSQIRKMIKKGMIL